MTWPSPKPASPRSAEEHVEEQLQAMIDSLVEDRQKQFNSRDNSGGQQQRHSRAEKPKLPSEAELRLLKKNQEAINKGTDADGQSRNKDKEVVLDLGRSGQLRNLLDHLDSAGTEGKQKLGAEPDNRDQLPEEAKKEDVDDQELTQDLLGDNPTEDSAARRSKLTGDRMARSRQRLALNDDPGAGDPGNPEARSSSTWMT